MKTILVAVDLGASTPLIIGQVPKLCRTDSRIHLLHVAEPDPAFVGWEAGPQSERDAVAERFHEERHAVQGLAEGLIGDGYDCTSHVVQGAFAETILAQASKLGADLIVMGTHGKGLASQLLMGSVSEQVIRSTTCPVLLVPVKDQHKAAGSDA